MISDINTKHAHELETLIKMVSELVGINFKYVKFSDIPVPIHMLLEYKKIQQDQSTWKKFITYFKSTKKPRKRSSDDNVSDSDDDWGLLIWWLWFYL